MNPQTPSFNSQHHDVYNALRNTLMGFVQAGIPGMDQVLNALNQQHTKMITPQQAAQQMGGGMKQPVQVSQPAQQSGGNPLANAAASLLQSKQGQQAPQGQMQSIGSPLPQGMPMNPQQPQDPMMQLLQKAHGYQ